MPSINIELSHPCKQERNGLSALAIAAKKGHFIVVEKLLGKGAKVNLQDIDGLSPLILAIHNGHLEVVKLLLKIMPNWIFKQKMVIQL